jgi:hypothetical protein
MMKCYICGEEAEASCFDCGKPVCTGHLTMINMTSFCTKYAQHGRYIPRMNKRIIYILMAVFMGIGAIIFFVFVLPMIFQVSQFMLF